VGLACRFNTVLIESVQKKSPSLLRPCEKFGFHACFQVAGELSPLFHLGDVRSRASLQSRVSLLGLGEREKERERETMSRIHNIAVTCRPIHQRPQPPLSIRHREKRVAPFAAPPVSPACPSRVSIVLSSWHPNLLVQRAIVAGP